jgi:hypothetical protein
MTQTNRLAGGFTKKRANPLPMSPSSLWHRRFRTLTPEPRQTTGFGFNPDSSLSAAGKVQVSDLFWISRFGLCLKRCHR